MAIFMLFHIFYHLTDDDDEATMMMTITMIMMAIVVHIVRFMRTIQQWFDVTTKILLHFHLLTNRFKRSENSSVLKSLRGKRIAVKIVI